LQPTSLGVRRPGPSSSLTLDDSFNGFIPLVWFSLEMLHGMEVYEAEAMGEVIALKTTAFIVKYFLSSDSASDNLGACIRSCVLRTL